MLKTFPDPGYLHSKNEVVWLCHFLVNLYIYASPYHPETTQSQCLMAIGRDSALSTLYHSCRLACQQRVLKTFPGPGYLCSKDGVVWLRHFLVYLHIYGSPFYSPTTQSQCLMTIARDNGLSILYHSCSFAFQQRVLKCQYVYRERSYAETKNNGSERKVCKLWLQFRSWFRHVMLKSQVLWFRSFLALLVFLLMSQLTPGMFLGCSMIINFLWLLKSDFQPPKRLFYLLQWKPFKMMKMLYISS